MARECKLRNNAFVKVHKQRKGWKKMEVVKQKDQRFLKYKGKFFEYCHCCHKFGHKFVDCRIKGKDQSTKSKRSKYLMEICGEESQITKTQKKHEFRTSVKFPKMMMSIIVL